MGSQLASCSQKHDHYCLKSELPRAASYARPVSRGGLAVARAEKVIRWYHTDERKRQSK